jgi:DNA-binding HxlR family transcriptional regulator
LEEFGFVNRKVFAVVPPRVEYSLTKRGKRSIEVVNYIRN